MKKTLTLLLIASLLFSFSCGLLSSCTQASDTSQAGESSPSALSTPTTPSSTASPDRVTTPSANATLSPLTTVTPLPADYPTQINGIHASEDELVFLYTEPDDNPYTANSIWTDPISYNTDLETAVYNRNQNVYETLGVEIKLIDAQCEPATLQEFAKTEFCAPTGAFDVYCGNQYYDIAVAAQNHLVDLNTILNEKGEKIINIEKDYWAGEYIDAIHYNDAMYWVTGDLSWRFITGLSCTFINKNIYEACIKSAFDDRDIFDVVKDGDWTFDAMLEMAALAYAAQSPENDDFVSFLYDTDESLYSFAFGSHALFSVTEKDSQGKETITYPSQPDTNTTQLAAKLNALFSADYSRELKEAETPLEILNDGNALFYAGYIGQNSKVCDNILCLPMPKLNTSQESYVAGVQHNVTLFGISKYSNRKILAAAALELMAYDSHRTITPLVSQASHIDCRCDEGVKQAELIRMMLEGAYTDFGTAFSRQIAGPNKPHQIYGVPEYLADIDNAYQLNTKAWNDDLKKILDAFDDLN